MSILTSHQAAATAAARIFKSYLYFFQMRLSAMNKGRCEPVAIILRIISLNYPIVGQQLNVHLRRKGLTFISSHEDEYERSNLLNLGSLYGSAAAAYKCHS